MNQDQTAARGFSGTLDHITLADLTQVICLAQMSQSIHVQSSQGSGTIHAHSGQIIHSEFGAAVGEEAFCAILRWKSGSFDSVPLEAESVTASIKRTWEYLLIEAMRYRIEGLDNDAESPTPAAASFAGHISGIQLPDLIQLACMAQRDRILEVTSHDRSGKIFVRSGQICHALLGKFQGEDAFDEILLAEEGEFSSLPPDEDVPQCISKPWEYLLMDAMRYRDEKMGREGDEEAETEVRTLLQKLQRMKVSEKIKLAMFGDKEARGLLVKDVNRLVQIAIVGNPKITEGEVASIANSRNVDEEVLRRIAGNREWMKFYPIRLALVTNPKCPLATATKLLQTLVLHDLKLIAKSKSVLIGVAQAARRLTKNDPGGK